MRSRPRGRCGGLHVLQFGTLCLVALLPLSLARVHQILWGRCYAYCLKTHLADASLDPDQTVSVLKNGIQTCQRHNVCKWCLYVCERPEDRYTDSESCLHDCRATRTNSKSAGRQACLDACTFLALNGSSKTGRCPAPDTLTGFESACIETCHGDTDCPNAQKCCDNGCGLVCTDPRDPEVLPDVPSNVTFRPLENGGVLVRWGHVVTSRDGEVLGPVMYILRWWCPYTDGTVTSITDQTRTRLKGYPTGIYPGAKCHFMVASVSIHGSQGFSKVSPYIKKFLAPSPPEQLEETRSTVKDGKVDVKIEWQPPLYTDGLAIQKYEVSWSDSLPRASPSYMRLHMYKKVVQADQLSFTLHSLSPGTIYFVQVRAVVEWKGRRKRGKPASMYVEVYSPPQQAAKGGPGEFSGHRGTESDIESLSISQAFFHSNILKASLTWKLKSGKRARKYLIYWKPQSCAMQVEHRKKQNRKETSATSHDEAFSLYNLMPECEYAVRVHPVSHEGRTGPAVVTSFQTPACHLIETFEGEEPLCEESEPPDQVKGLHTETVACTTVVRWTPLPAGSDVANYLVKWGESDGSYVSSSTIIYSSNPEELQVTSNETAVTLGHLEPGRHFTVQVMGQSSAGFFGPPAVQHLTVPQNRDPCSQEELQGHAVSVKSDTTAPSPATMMTPWVSNSTNAGTANPKRDSQNTLHINFTLTDNSSGITDSGEIDTAVTTGPSSGRQNVTQTDNGDEKVKSTRDRGVMRGYKSTLRTRLHNFVEASTRGLLTRTTQEGAGAPPGSRGDHLQASCVCLVLCLVIAMTFSAKAFVHTTYHTVSHVSW